MKSPIRYVPLSNTSKGSLEMANLLAKAVGGPFKILLPLTDKMYYPNGSVAGPMKMLFNGDADVVMLSTIYSEENKTNIDFAYPHRMDTVTFMIPKNTITSDVSSIFRPFSFETWIAVLVSSFGMSLFLYALLMKRCPFSHILKNILCSLLQQSVRFKLEGEKRFMFTWFLGVFFLRCCYMSLLLSFLTFPPQNEIRDIQKLAEEVKTGRYEVFANFQLIVDRLLISEDESMKIIGKSIEENSYGVESLKNFVLKKNRNMAFISPRIALNLLQDRFFISNDYFFFYPLSFLVRKGFCCTERLNMGIHRITAAGFFSRYYNSISSKYVHMIKSNAYKQDDNNALTLSHLQGAFLILGTGLSLAFVRY